MGTRPKLLTMMQRLGLAEHITVKSDGETYYTGELSVSDNAFVDSIRTDDADCYIT